MIIFCLLRRFRQILILSELIVMSKFILLRYLTLLMVVAKLFTDKMNRLFGKGKPKEPPPNLR